MFENIVQIDHTLFSWINQQAVTPSLDVFFIFITEAHKNPWVQKLVFPLVLALWFWRGKKYALKAFAVTLLCIGLSDNISHRLIKPIIARERPPQHLELNAIVRQSKPANGYSFPSNHATNAATGATVLSFYYPPLTVVFATYALLVAYSRAYVGVHFPLDILGGLFLGWMIAFILTRFVIIRWPRFHPRPRGVTPP